MTQQHECEPLYRELIPHGRSALYVRMVWVLRASGSTSAAQAVVPDGCPEIVLNLGEPVIRVHDDGRCEVHPNRLLVGQMTAGTRLQTAGEVYLAGIRLHPWAASAFLDLPAALTVDRIQPLEDVVPSSRIAALLPVDEEDPEAVGQRLLRAISAYVPRLPEPSSLARAALGLLSTAAEPYSVRALARLLGSGERRLQRAFTNDVGLSPKLIVRILRTQRAMGLALAQPHLTWAQVAARSGYHDHAHLVRDFRQFALQTPTAFRSEAGLLTEHLLA